MKRILLIVLGLSTVLLADFSRTGNIVTDSATDLQWQDNEALFMDWTTAKGYCETLSLGGHDDWRLPNIVELASLVDEHRWDPAINEIFEFKEADNYWSSTKGLTEVLYAHYAWIVHFEHGYRNGHDKSQGVNAYVRCVRAGQD